MASYTYLIRCGERRGEGRKLSVPFLPFILQTRLLYDINLRGTEEAAPGEEEVKY